MPHSEKSWRSRLTTRSQKSYIKVPRNSKRICSLLYIFEKNKYSMQLSHLLCIILFHSFLSSRASMWVQSHLSMWKQIPKPICSYRYLTYRTSFVSMFLLGQMQNLPSPHAICILSPMTVQAGNSITAALLD